MGFGERAAQAAQKARVRQRDGILEEAAKAGARVLDIAEMGSGASGSSVAGSMGKVFFGGKVSIDDAQVFTFDSQGFPHVYIQPYDGLNPVPGFHHATLAGNVGQSATLTAKAFGRKRWLDDNGESIESLNDNPILSMVGKTLEWKWKAGTTEIELPWTVKLSPAENGVTELTLRAGRYGGFTTFGVGIGVFLGLSRSVHTMLASSTAGA
jgi:hypothetical protein